MTITRLIQFALFCLTASACLAAGDDAELSTLPLTRTIASAATSIPSLANIRFPHPASPCHVAALPEIEDREALELETGVKPAGVVEMSGLAPELARALTRFRQLVSTAGGTFELQSAYRPEAYQEHLAAVWTKWMLELRRNREPGCQALRAEVGAEFARHKLMETQRPVTSSDHTRGLAFDAAVRMPRMARIKGRRVSLDRLALLAGIRRPDVRRDPVHFRLVITPASSSPDPLVP